MITQDNYLDVGNLLINELFGDVGLFIIVGLVLLAYYSARNGLPYQVFLVLALLFSGLVVSYVYNSLLWVLVLFLIGLAIYGLFARGIKSN